tara:strand:+ start:2827 stop:3282 length:456 start_codon:yes stop_codon:yes gene_type:complete
MTESTELQTAERLERREKIVALEKEMLKLPQIEIPTEHYFAPGVYMRQVTIPKGATVTGKIHKTEHMNILSKGKLLVETEEGVKELTASTVIKSKPGAKRVGHALEESVWITVHPNPENILEVEKLEDMLVVDTFDQFLEFTESRKIGEVK